MKNLKPSAISWVITLILLLIAACYNVYVHGEFGIAGIIFFASLVVYFTAYLIYRKNNRIN